MDRYSFGLGIFQSDADAEITQISGQNTEPSAYARVRIDCETENAEIIDNYDGDVNTLSADKTTADYSDTTSSIRVISRSFICT